MAAVLNHLDGDVAQITDLFVVAHVANIGQVAAGVDYVDVAILTDDLFRQS